MVAEPFPTDLCARLLAALAAPERLRIVRFLAGGPHTVTEIVAMLGVPAVNVSHHLAVLKQADIVRACKRGRFVDYSLRAGVLAEANEGSAPGAALDLGCCRLVLPPEPPLGGHPT